MAGMQETDHITLKNGITYLLQDAKARAQLADLLVEVMEKYGADNPPPYPVTSVNGQTGDVDIPTVNLPVSVQDGGTGADNAADARTNLGLGNVATENVVPLSKGGTGANNAADARTNLAVLPLAGGTVTGQVKSTYADADGFLIEHGTANKDACFRATRSDTGVSVIMGVGSGGTNHGLYSYKLNKWMVYANGSDVYCNGTATNVTGTVAIDHGGTGATSAAAARTNLGAIAMPTVIVKNATTTSSDEDATYTVSGSGVVIVFAGMLSDDTNDYGTFQSRIYYDGSTIMGEGTRWGSALNYALGASTAVPIAVSNGKKIRIYLRNTKYGTKYVYRRFLCFGCTVS